MKQLFYLLSFVIFTAYAIPKEYYKEPVCGYNSCPKSDPNVLNIHLIPHSHDDVGWLNTVDQYYYGTKSFYHPDPIGVRYILDSVVSALLLYPNRRFIFVESAYFWKWWQDRTEADHDRVRYLIKNGQLEIAGGGWSMNDEAATHYQSIIDQFTWGLRKFNDTLGKCSRPKIGWQIDPFGHSKEQTSLFTQFGFDGLFITRLDYRDKNKRLQSKTAEFVWQGSQNLGTKTRLFTSILYDFYMTPPNFCFDVMCHYDQRIIDDKESPEYNADKRAREFLQFVKNQAKYYDTNNVFITMGGDFHYQNALSYFTNMDSLMKAVEKEDPNVKIFYSTPACYVKAVNEANKSYNLVEDDFFPYASDEHSYWTGFFTSRPTSKRMERLGNNILQVSKQLSAAAFAHSFNETVKLNPLRETMGIMQHHDAITGTEKQHVADDYARLLHKSMEASLKLASDSLKKLYIGDSLEFQSCLMLNISECRSTEQNNKFLLTVYNPLSRYLDHYVRLPVPNVNYIVYNASGHSIETQFVPIFKMIENIPGRNSIAKYELVFRADNIPPLGQKIFYIKYAPNYVKNYQRNFNNHNKIQLDNKNNIESYKLNNGTIEVKAEFLYYNSYVGERSSGAYIFRPANNTANLVKTVEKSEMYSGPHVSEHFQQFDKWIGRITRVYEKKNYIEHNWIVGPIPTDKKIGKEVITRFTTKLQSKNVFYTDSNGREMVKRIRGYRSSFNLTNEEPVSQNYYPITSKITLQDLERNVQFSVLNDRAQGGSSLQDGVVEIMVHRRLHADDKFGVDEPLNEEAFGKGLVATGKHYIVGGFIQNTEGLSASAQERLLAQEILLQPLYFISPIKNDFNINLAHLEASILKNPLPENVHILSLEPWADNKILLRLEHILEKNEDLLLSKPATVNLLNLFSVFTVQNVQEMTLDGNQKQSEVERLKWIVKNDNYNKNIQDKQMKQNNNFLVTIEPMEIKTFVINIEYNIS